MPISTSVRHLRAFLAVAEAGSTAGAARALRLSQPSVSVAIKELEEILGHPLFQRLPARGLVPTPFGQRKLPEARALASSLAAFQQAGDKTGDVAGHVTFGYFTTLGPQYVPGILRRMAQRYPQVSVSPVEADLDALNHLLEAGRIELALSYDVEIGPRIATERVAELAPYVLLPRSHALARRRAVTPAELAEDPFILVDLPLSREFLLSAFRAEGIEPRIAHRTRSLEMVIGMVANGLGISVLVTRRASDRAYDGKQVIRKPLAGSRLRQGVVLAWPDWSTLTPPAQALASCIRAELATSKTRGQG
jgi:DNA-binding transcriptional LysR family regulator